MLDPIVCGFHLTRALMGRGISLNLLYQDIVRQMGIDCSMIKPTKTSFKGVIPGVKASCIGSITLEVVFGSPNNHHTKGLVFNIVPLCSNYYALLGRAMFNAVSHYAYGKLTIQGPRDVIAIMGKAELDLGAKEFSATLTTKAASCAF